MKPKEFLKQIDDAQVVAAIKVAEQKTSGEIRVFVTDKEVTDPVVAAQAAFDKMGMTKTAARNGVLIFLAPRSQKFAVIGDQGIHQHCGPEFWIALAAGMSDHFRREAFTPGLIHGIRKAGELLAAHFPRTLTDENELPDRIERD